MNDPTTPRTTTLRTTTPGPVFPRPVHIVSNGDALHGIIHARLHERAGATMSVVSMPTSNRGGGAHVARWVKRQMDLDGPVGALGALARRGRQGLRVGRSILSDRRALRRRDEADAEYIETWVQHLPARTEGVGDVSTLVTVGRIDVPDTAFTHHVTIHLGWPPLAGRDGMLSALTHRDLHGLCVVLEATGAIEGWALAWPPLCEDDDADRIARRLASTAAELLSEVLDDPTRLHDDRPTFGVTTPVVDRAAVAADAKSMRLLDLIRSSGRF